MSHFKTVSDTASVMRIYCRSSAWLYNFSGSILDESIDYRPFFLFTLNANVCVSTAVSLLKEKVSQDFVPPEFFLSFKSNSSASNIQNKNVLTQSRVRLAG